MASTLSIRSLRPCSVGRLLRARLYKVWPAQRAGETPFGANFVLIDAEGSAIQGFVAIRRYNKMLDVFVEGRVLEFRRFSVERLTIERIKKGYLAVGKDISFVITERTVVQPVCEEVVPIPRQYYELKQLEDLGTSVLPEFALGDVLARIAGFGPVETVFSDGHSVRIRQMYLANERSTQVEVALWDRFVDQFHTDELVLRSKKSPVLVGCSSLLVRVRKYVGTLSFTTFLGTRFFFDVDIPHAAEFRSSLGNSVPEIFLRLDNPLLHASPARGLVPAGTPPRRVNIAQLLLMGPAATRDTKFECVGQVIALTDWYRWYYPSCPKCNHKVRDGDNDLFYCDFSACELHDQTVHPVPWYRLQLQVSDGECQIGFVLFGKVAEFAVGSSAETVLAEEDPSSDDAPSKLLDLVGKRFLFSVSAGKSKSYVDHTEFIASRVGPVPPDAPLLSLPVPQSAPPSPEVAANLLALSSAGPSGSSFSAESSDSLAPGSSDNPVRDTMSCAHEWEVVDPVDTPPSAVSDVQPDVNSKKAAAGKGGATRSGRVPIKRELDYNVPVKSKNTGNTKGASA